MTERSKSEDVRATALRLIELTGSKAAANRAIDDAEMKGHAGRPKGSSPYAKIDAELMFLVESLLSEYRLAGQSEPKLRALIAQAIDIHQALSSPARVGSSKRAAVERLTSRSGFASMLFDAIKAKRPELLKYLPEDAEARLRSIENDPSRPNFSMLFMAIIMVWGLVRRDPDRFSVLAANDEAATEFVRFLSDTDLGFDDAPSTAEKTEGD